jgi:hypothetical protein
MEATRGRVVFPLEVIDVDGVMFYDEIREPF